MSRTARRVARLALAAALVLGASTAGGATTHWWRLENPAPLADAIGVSPLTPLGDAHAVALPVSGRGGSFPPGFAPDAVNEGAAEFDGAGDLITASVAPITSDFTIECFANVDAVVSPVGDILVALGSNLVAPFTFGLQIRLDGVGGTQPRELMLFVGAPGGAVFTVVGSGIVLQTGKDYYIAASFDLASPAQVTFYVQNLSDAGPLQVVTKPHTLLAVEQSSLLTIGGLAYTTNTDFDGLIDEVRLSTHVLAPSELLINQVAQIPALPGFSPLLVALALGGASAYLARARLRGGCRDG